jgi:hypothetical protein
MRGDARGMSICRYDAGVSVENLADDAVHGLRRVDHSHPRRRSRSSMTSCRTSTRGNSSWVAPTSRAVVVTSSRRNVVSSIYRRTTCREVRPDVVLVADVTAKNTNEHDAPFRVRDA